MNHDAVIAEFVDPWEARLARHYLEDAGIEARLEEAGSDQRLTGEGGRLVRLIVPADDADEAQVLLTEMDEERLRPEEPTEARRPLWIPAVALLVAFGLIWAAVPRFLWPWILLVGFVGFLLWRAAGPRTPGA